MTTEDLLVYILSKIKPIRDKYKDINICNVGPEHLCENTKMWQKPGTGCCIGCHYHTIKNGCNIINLCCLSFFCDEVKNKIDPADWKKMKSVILVLQGFGLDPRTTWQQQINTMKLRENFLKSKTEDFYEIFKAILENEK
jgi:hypothetical protein